MNDMVNAPDDDDDDTFSQDINNDIEAEQNLKKAISEIRELYKNNKRQIPEHVERLLKLLKKKAEE
jgi:hypothetical protein